MNDFIALILVGASFGSAFALLALSINVIYSSSNILNFAQGEFMMLGGMLGWLFYSVGHVNYAVAFGLVALITALVGVVEYYAAVWPLLRRRAPLISILISTLGFSIVMRMLTALSMGRVQRFGRPPLGENAVYLLGVAVVPQTILIFLATGIALTIIWWLYSGTTLGLALRAAAVNTDSAQIVGINVSRVIAGTFAAGGAIAGIAGLLLSPLSYASPWLGLDFAIEGFAAAIIGGLGSWRGAVIGGVLVGISRTLILTYVSASWGSLFTLGLILIVLLLRPTGLFGEWQATTHGAK